MAANDREQTAGMATGPQPEHRWLHRLVGEWTYEAEALMEPGSPLEKCSGSENVRSLGDLWILAEGEGQMPDGSLATMLMTLGYDTGRKRFVGTWIGSMMAHLWVYDGALDAGGTALTLDSEGPGMTGREKMTRFRDVIEFRSNNLRTLTSQMQAEDGSWLTVMTASYRRK